MKIIPLIIIALMIIVLFIFFALFPWRQTQSSFTHKTTKQQTPFVVSYAIFTNNIFQSFTSKASDTIRLAENNPNRIEIHKPPVRWQQVFDTLGFSITPTCLTTQVNETFCSNETTGLRFFLNGTENPQLLTTEVKPNDRILITYGVTTEDQVRQQFNSIPAP